VFERLRFGEKLAAVSALALCGFLFLDWFGNGGLEGVYFNRAVGAPAHAGVFSASNASGWHSLGWLTLALCALAIAAGIALPFVLAVYESPVLPVFGAIVTMLLAGLAAIAIVVQGVFQPHGGAVVVRSGYWLGLIAAFGIARGGFVSMRDEYLPGVPVADVEVRPAPPAIPAGQTGHP
jgi:hypothetical protein